MTANPDRIFHVASESLRDGPAGRGVGVLLCHGFTGSPCSMTPWADSLGALGYSTSVPLLPGHGTRWQDLNLTRWTDWYAEVEHALIRLAAHCDKVFVAGLSMGGTLAIRLTEQYAGVGRRSLGSQFAGTMLVNPSLMTERKDAVLLPFVQRFIRSFPGIANDIAKPGVNERAYPRLPLKAAYSLSQLWDVCRADLSSIDVPVLLYRSLVDHTVEAISSSTLLAAISSSDVSVRLLRRSHHVATLDYDAPFIFADSAAWIASRI
ncbi:MAG: alpha/beta fold hydrolase [Antricoccus sp.]